MQYYIWTDEEGDKHVTDRPPENREYETRTIEFDEGTGTSGGSTPSGTDAVSSSKPRTASAATAGSEGVASQLGETEDEKSKLPPPEGLSGVGRAILLRRGARVRPGPVPDAAGHTSPPRGGRRLNQVPAFPDISDLPDLREP